MSTFYDDASLALIPSGIKDGKVYSIKPTNGDGDFTFSRGTDTATRVNASGLIEKERGNLLPYSNDFSNVAWTKQDSTATSGQSGYDGSSDAWLLSKSDAGGQLNTFISTSVSTYSVYAKAGTLDWLRLYIDISGSNTYAFYNLASGVVGTTSNDISTTIESIGSGWYRCTLTAKNGGLRCRINPADADNDISGTSGNIYIQDAQLEQGLVATDYIETTSSAVYEGITDNLPRLDYSGGASCPSLLLEPSRTNVIAHSEYLNDSGWSPTGVSVTSNYGTSPEGVQNSTRLVLSSTASGRMAEGLSLTDGTTYTLSCWYKGTAGEVVAMRGLGSGGSGTDVVKTITLTGDWQREDLQFVAGSSSNVIYVVDSREITDPDEASDFEVYGVQCESGSYPTSYIPTYGTSASRAGDSCSKTGISDLIGQTEGTMFVDVTINNLSNQSNNPIVLTLKGSGSTSSYIQIYNNGRVQAIHYGFGSIQANINLTSYGLTDGKHKFAFVYSENNFKLFIDGNLAGSDTSGLVDAQSEVYVGYYNTFFNGSTNNHQALVFPTALTDAECIALTTI